MKKARVLIIDSDIVFTLNASRAFSDSGMFEVVGTEHDGINGIRRIHCTAPDIVLIDIQLPGLDGLSVLKETRYMKSPPVFIMCTGFYSDFCVLNAQQNGAAYVLYKPLDYNTLPETVSSCYKSVHSAEYRRQRITKKREIQANDTYRIKTLLFDMGMSPRFIGCTYLVESILLASDNRMLLCNLSKGLYCELAQKMNTSASCVERSLRNAISVTYERGRMKSIFDRKPTNKQFLTYLIDRISENA